jgi:ribonuclease VapC
MSAANTVEAAIVVDAARSLIATDEAVTEADTDEAVTEAGIVIEPATREQAETARAGYRGFGKGSCHPAGLNFGDCFACALARARILGYCLPISCDPVWRRGKQRGASFHQSF